MDIYNNSDMLCTIKHRVTPNKVGKIIPISIHFVLPVSFRMVKQVVEHGQWKRENRIKHTAVTDVQPF